MIFTYIFLHRIIESNRQLRGNHTHALCFFNKGPKQRTWTGTFSINCSYETRFPYTAKKTYNPFYDQLQRPTQVNSKLIGNLDATQKTNKQLKENIGTH